MQRFNHSRNIVRSERGAALIIVLFFVVLITSLTVIFLSRSMTAHQISNSSAGEAKVNLLAQSAGDIIIGDLKQEIIDGSTSTNVTTGVTIYTPKTGDASLSPMGISTAAPALVGFTPTYASGVETDGLANLLKVSKYGLPFYSSATNGNYSEVGPNRASNVASTAASLNGHVISTTRWNSHYLLGRATTGSTLDSTPTSSFVPPDWVLVTRSGANTPYASINSTLADSTPSNTNYVIGRYAYAIYNEGGLLDMNVAGYPGTAASSGSLPASTGLTASQLAIKTTTALADLTMLNTNSAPALSPPLTQNQINNIVGWRNYYTSQMPAASGTFGAVSYSSTTTANWLTNFVNYNATNGFMAVNTTTNSTTMPSLPPPTDQAFLSRQQLISLSQSLSICPDALQYLGTFSRALEQPSFTPNPNRPKVINPATSPPSISSSSGYVGNNDGVNKDDSYNPNFLSARVGTGGWTRWNGATAVAGEPLVKRKFALTQLELITYQSTNTSLPSGLKGHYTDSDPIYDRFGLKRTSNSSPWRYNHGNDYIMTLTQVAAANREPDFAELLKAAISIGSMAKAAPNLGGGFYNWNYGVDSTLDYQVLHIMANLIDQYDADSYPTQIEILLPSSTNYRVISGDEDLPYIYRSREFAVVDTLPSAADIITQAQNGTKVASAGFTGGDVKIMMQADLWNPHDANTLATSSTLRPTQFQLYAMSTDPDGITTSWMPCLAVDSPHASGTPGNPGCPWVDNGDPSNYGTTAALTQANSAINIKDSSLGLAFREPTMIWRPTQPFHVTMTVPTETGAGKVVDAATGVTYVGFVLGSMPVEATGTGNNIWQIKAVKIDPNWNLSRPTGSYGQITFCLAYLDPNGSGNYITYDNHYLDFHGFQTVPQVVTNVNDSSNFANKDYLSPFRSGQISTWACSMMDPRSVRFGVGSGNQMGSAGCNWSGGGSTGTGRTNGSFLLEPTAYTNLIGGAGTSGTVLQNGAIGNTWTVLETSRPRADAGNVTAYSNPCQVHDYPALSCPPMRFFSGVEYRSGTGDPSASFEFDGMLSQNSALIQSATLSQSKTLASAQLYFEDPDGMNRRAMGAYQTATLLGQAAGDTTAASEVGLPLVTANTYGDGGTLTTASILPQSQSRPMILNRAFRSVSDMSYAFRGTPWQNINFFTPESGDSAMLDTFCVNEPPSSAIVAGKVDLNSRQVNVLAALISGSVRDEYAAMTSPPAAAKSLPVLTATEATNIAKALTSITTDTTHAWRGPLENVSGLVGRFIANPGTTGAATDLYTYSPPSITPATVPALPASYTYAGLSAALDSTVYTGATLPAGVQAKVPYTIQRFREAGLRPLMDCGQTRVWNLLIDVVAQTGRYPKTATGLDQFTVDGEKRIWLHVAIDRYTGQIIDKQVEVVAQ